MFFLKNSGGGAPMAMSTEIWRALLRQGHGFEVFRTGSHAALESTKDKGIFRL